MRFVVGSFYTERLPITFLIILHPVICSLWEKVVSFILGAVATITNICTTVRCKATRRPLLPNRLNRIVLIKIGVCRCTLKLTWFHINQLGKFYECLEYLVGLRKTYMIYPWKILSITSLTFKVLQSLLVVLWHLIFMLNEKSGRIGWLIRHFRRIFKLFAPCWGSIIKILKLDLFGLTNTRKYDLQSKLRKKISISISHTFRLSKKSGRYEYNAKIDHSRLILVCPQLPHSTYFFKVYKLLELVTTMHPAACLVNKGWNVLTGSLELP